MVTRDKVIKMGSYIVENEATVRQTARAFGVSKTKVHLDMTTHLIEFDRELGNQVASVLAYHKSVRHLRGGEATRMMWGEVVT